ncbi:hypothetical protein PACILC2_22900 [Paenibacillus cisolokensis]|uniref:Siphovirus-type tail component RIFT-related domain-containing protein n=1 Tax=Paenibacillus cisolokensis TaxID=1658519 RepID=A0ABQ4N6B9_9BACL|nr:distal tail protein Dit [Paenibacillus cisolokensis]GIQ63722.1 hypothetical protein PACILC2_22900 [Paenibacillus cisolokensis]
MAWNYGFTYRGRHCSEFGLKLIGYRVNAPDIREYEDEVGGVDGVIDYGTELGKREIEVRVDVISTDEPLAQRQSRIMAWLTPKQDAGALIFDEFPEWRYFAKYSGRLTLDQIGRYGEFTITFKCTDPFAYGPERIQEMTITSSPFTIHAPSDGAVPTPPVFELTNVGTTTLAYVRLTNEFRVD